MKSLFPIIVSVFALLIFGPTLCGQSAEQEALSNLVKHGWSLRGDDPQQAFTKIEKALETALSLGDEAQTARCFYMMAVLQHDLENYPPAFGYAESAKSQYQQNGSKPGLANALDLLANITLKSGDYLQSSKYYKQEIDLILATPSLNHLLASTYVNYATLFHDLGFNDYALEYFMKSERLLADTADFDRNVLILDKAQVYLELNQFSKATELGSTAYDYFSSIDDQSLMANCLNVKGCIALFEERYSEATQLFSEALSLTLRDSTLDIEGRINYLVNLSKSYLGEKNNKAAYQAINKAYLLAQTKIKSPTSQLNCVQQLSEYYQSQGVLDSAMKYLNVSHELQFQIFDQNRELSVLLADTKLRKDENTRELAQKEVLLSEVKATQYYLYIGLAALGIILVVFGGAFWQYDQKKKTEIELMLEKEKNQAQLLEGVIKKQELKSISYIIEGQESEKKRVAEELHDGLGGTLAAVRISLEQFRRQLKSQESLDLQDFDYAFDLLREATEDVRRISHDMGAVRLKHGGLVTALEDMCRNLSRHQSFVASLDTEGIEMLRINSEVEFHLYRIAQELFQNIIKHANAKSVKIQLTNAGGRLHLYMWDDGNGFDVDAVADGMGMQNLKIRTQQLNGKIHIDSTIGKGTYTHISLPV
ncbi:MAG: ATP-binding protein [Bacteroidia bacterium]